MEEEHLRFTNEEGFTGHNHMRVTAVERGFCRAQAELSPESMNIHGFAHGGVAYTLCDTAAGGAASSLGRRVVTRSASVHYLEPGRQGPLTAEARVIHAGSHMALCRAEVRDGDGKLLVTGDFEMFFIDQPG